MAERDIPRDEAEAALQTRHHLGQEYEPAIVESFVERLDEAIERRVSEEVSRRLQDSGDRATTQAKEQSSTSGHTLALAIVSLSLSLPLTAIVIGGEGGTGMVVLIWAAIVAVNMIFALSNRGSRRHG